MGGFINMSNKETIFLEEGQIVFLQSDYENKLVLTSVKVMVVG